MDKKAVRKEVTQRKKLMSEEEVAFLSAELKERFCSLDEYKNAAVIYAYMSYNQEVRTKAIIEQAWRDGKKVAVPKTYNKEYMEFIYIDSFGDIVPGYMDIPEPSDEISSKEAGRIADAKEVLILMPGLAFDRYCNRTGYGGGFYDRYLDSRPQSSFTKVALCFDFQIYDHLEVEEHDEKMDLVVSNSAAYRRAK